MEDDEWFTLAELTDRLGALVWVEEQVADVLQSWSAIESEASAAILYAQSAGHHRWHGEVIRTCLPTSPQLGAIEAIRAPTKGWEAAVGSLQTVIDPAATTARLKAIVKIIDPWLEREIGALLDLSRPVSDAAMQRWMTFVSLDHHDDGESAAALLANRANEAVRFDDHRAVNELDLR